MEGTILMQGRFTSDGTNKKLAIRSDVDFIRVYNSTVAAANQTTAKGVEYYWQRGFASGAKWTYFKSNAANAANLSQYITSNGFNLIDTSQQTLTAPVAVSGATNATQPVVSTGSTAGLATGDIVRLSSLTGQENLAGIDFQIDTVVANTSFRWAYPIATAPGAAATAGNWRKVNYDPIFYPRRRFIGNISVASNAVVSCTADHGLTVGQAVRVVVPEAYGMTQMNNLLGTITAVPAANQLTLNIDSSAFTAFKFPLPADVPFSYALVIPVGEDTAQAITSSVNLLADATVNTAIIGMELVAGADCPGGENNDVLYYVAGKSTYVNNE